jgi:hypothetical protein
MPKGSRCFGSHATRIAINGSVAAENSGHVSGTVKHSQYECTVVERLEDDRVISVCAKCVLRRPGLGAPYIDAVRRNLLAVLPYSPPGLWPLRHPCSKLRAGARHNVARPCAVVRLVRRDSSSPRKYIRLHPPSKSYRYPCKHFPVTRALSF